MRKEDVRSTGIMTSLTDPQVRQFIEETVGENGMRLVELLESKESATDTELAETLGEKPSHIRKILYALYEARVAEYQKEKDKESGWLTFFWRITPEGAEHAIEQKRLKELGKLEAALQFEESHDWFICPQGHERFDFVQASEIDFQCPEHEHPLEHHDNDAEIQNIQRRIRALKEHADNQSAPV
jgi:transcription initiation factor TFIIE subunit alpha